MIKGALIAGYIAVGIITYGYVFNSLYVDPTLCGPQPTVGADVGDWERYSAWRDCRYPNDGRTSAVFIAGFPATLAGAIWPAYWAGKVSIELNKGIVR